MRMDDEQVERYSRQIVLAEVGVEGQLRLGASRVAVVGDGIAAERVVAYLAAAGVGAIAADPALHAAADPALPGLRMTPLPLTTDERDATIVSAATVDAAAHALRTWDGRAARTFWIAEGIAGGSPPCPRCAAATLGAGGVDEELRALREVVLGTVVATEVVKVLLDIGTSFAAHALAYDPATATITRTAVEARPGCECRSLRASAPA